MSRESTRLLLTAFGGPEKLETATGAVPDPGPDEVRIRVEASCVQFTDTLIRRGAYPDLHDKPPLTMGYDVVGVVEAVGPGVRDVAVGDRVADLCTIGGNAQHVVRSASGLVPVPASVDAARAATLVLSWLSAQQAVFRVGALTSNERLLVLGGNGAVGRAAVALAVAAGAEVHATASERHHHELKTLGAKPLPREGWGTAVRGRMDVVLDGIAAEGFRPSYRALRRGGRLVVIGFSSLAGSSWRFVTTFLGLGLRGLVPDGRAWRIYSIAAHRKKHPAAFREDLAGLFAKLERGEINPTFAERISFADVPEAHRRLEAGGLTGKLVLDPWADDS